MNDKCKIITIILALACNFTFLLTAQTPHELNIKPGIQIPECLHAYGKDSMETRRNMAYFQENWKSKNYNKAYRHWTYVFLHAPCAFKSIYQIGPMLISQLIDDPANIKRRTGLIDTLMMTFPARIKYFGEQSFVNGSEAFYMAKYKPGQVDQIINRFNDYFFHYEGKKDDRYVRYLMYNAMIAMQAGFYEKSQACELYIYLSDTAEAYKATAERQEDVKNWTFTTEYLDQVLTTYITCSDLDSIYARPLKFATNDKEFLRHAIKLYSAHKGCAIQVNLPDLLEKYYVLEPGATAAEKLGDLFSQQKNTEKARTYYDKAIELHTDKQLQLAIYHKQMSLLQKQDIQSAMGYALNALQINPHDGQSLIIQGMALYRNRCGDKFEQAMAACAAIDLFKKAKAKDATSIKLANEQIAAHRKYLPSKADVQAKKLKAGATYTISCSGYSTTVQTR